MKVKCPVYNTNIQISNILYMALSKFIVKLLQMMKEFPQIVNWSTDGYQLQISDVDRFQSLVHPRYFTTSNYKSFLRQLNMYNFSKMSKRKNSVSFKHALFRRDNQDQFKDITRRQQKNATHTIESIDQSSHNELPEKNIINHQTPDTQQSEDIMTILKQLRHHVSTSGIALLDRAEMLLGSIMTNLCVAFETKPPQQSKIRIEKDFISYGRLEQLICSKAEPFTQSIYNYNFQSRIFPNGDDFDC